MITINGVGPCEVREQIAAEPQDCFLIVTAPNGRDYYWMLDHGRRIISEGGEFHREGAYFL